MKNLLKTIRNFFSLFVCPEFSLSDGDIEADLPKLKIGKPPKDRLAA
jgi:hypothetical protein